MQPGADGTFRVFVGGIPVGFVEEDLLQGFFSQYGEVKRVLIKYKENSKQPRGFAFVDYVLAEDAQRAITNAEGYQFVEKLLDCKYAAPESGEPEKCKNRRTAAEAVEEPRIFIGGLPMSATEATVQDHFQFFGPVTEVILKRNLATGDFRGFGFVNFVSTDSVRAVVDNYDNNLFEGKWIDCKVAVHSPPGQKGDSRAPYSADYGKGKGKGKGGPPNEFDSGRIFVGGIPKDCTAAELGSHYSQLGEVTDVSIKCDKHGANRGFAYVSFSDPQVATDILADYENNTFRGKWVACKASLQGDEATAAKKRSAEEENQMVLVEGLPLTSDVTSEAMVKQFFEHFGPVHEVRIDRDDQGAVRGTARVIFDSSEIAKDVVARYGPEAREVVEFLGNALGITTVHYNRLSPASVAGKGDARKQAQKGEKGDKGPTVRRGEKGDKGKGKGFGEDWTCPNCGVMVFASKSECFKCGTGKHSDAGGKGKGVDLVCKGGFDAGRSDPTEKIFIAGVPKDLTEHALAEYYSKFGAVKELHLPFDADTGQLRGFCFITFETCEAAAEAVKTGGLGEARLDYGQKKGGGKKAAEAPRPTDFFLRVSELPDNPRQRDTFKLFYSYSTARFRDFGSEAIVEFVSV
ncbi:unnamed protein product, partial [Polarella glacialis]